MSCTGVHVQCTMKITGTNCLNAFRVCSPTVKAVVVFSFNGDLYGTTIIILSLKSENQILNQREYL